MRGRTVLFVTLMFFMGFLFFNGAYALDQITFQDGRIVRGEVRQLTESLRIQTFVEGLPKDYRFLKIHQATFNHASDTIYTYIGHYRVRVLSYDGTKFFLEDFSVPPKKASLGLGEVRKIEFGQPLREIIPIHPKREVAPLFSPSPSSHAMTPDFHSSLLSAIAFLDAGDLENGQRKVEETLKENPKSVLAISLAGWIALQNDNPKKALKIWMPPRHSVDLRYLSGLLAMRLKKFRRASHEMKVVIKLSPSFLPAYRYLAIAMILTGDPNQASTVLNRAEEIAEGKDPWPVLRLWLQRWEGDSITFSSKLPSQVKKSKEIAAWYYLRGSQKAIEGSIPAAFSLWNQSFRYDTSAILPILRTSLNEYLRGDNQKSLEKRIQQLRMRNPNAAWIALLESMIIKEEK